MRPLSLHWPVRSRLLTAAKRYGLVVLAVLVGFVITAANAASDVALEDAPGTGAAELARKALHNLYGSSYIQVLEFATFAQSGAESSQRRLQIVRLEDNRDAKAIMRFLSPLALDGTGILFVSRGLGDVDVFMYLPSFRTTRRISGANREDSFFGTALSFADLEPKYVDDYNVVNEGPAIDGSCTQLRLEGRTQLLYDRIDVCAEPVTAVVHRLRLFVGDTAVKEVVPRIESTRRVGSRWLPFEFEVRDVSSGRRTLVATTRYEEVAGAAEALFTVGNLERGTPRGDYEFTTLALPQEGTPRRK